MNEALDMDNWRDESQDARERRNWWWQTLRTLKQQWAGDAADGPQFDGWVADTHGITVLRDGQGNILGDYEITDEGKHLVFLLKYR